MKRKMFLLGSLALMVAGSIFWSCQKDELIDSEELMLKKAVKSEFIFTSNKDANFCAGDDLELTLTGSGNKQIQMLVDGEWVQVAMVPHGDAPLVATLTNVAAGVYYFRHTSGTGFRNAAAIVISSCNGCEDLDVDLVCGEDGGPNVLTVTFTAGAAGDYVIQGGLNAKVEGDVISKTAEDKDAEEIGSFNQLHNGVVNSNANVIRWEGTLDECETVVITVEFSGKCEIGSWTAKID
jgi:hypothetical protein